MGRPRTFAAALLVVWLLAAGCGSHGDTGGNGVVSDVSSSDNDGYTGALLETPYRVPDVTLDDTAVAKGVVAGARDEAGNVEQTPHTYRVTTDAKATAHAGHAGH